MIAYDFVLCIYEPIRSRSNIVRISLPSNLLEREINKITLPEAFCADRLDRSDNLRYQLYLTCCLATGSVAQCYVLTFHCGP